MRQVPRTADIGRIVNDMANLRQDRASGPTLPQSSNSASQAATTNGHQAGSSGIALAIRLLTANSSGSPVAVSWPADSPVAALAIDIITASGGVPEPPGADMLAARFPDMLPALLAARRLQWALHGLAESSHTAVTPFIVLHRAEDADAASLAPALNELGSAQFLLSPELADSVHPMPGLAVQPAGNGKWCIAEWQSPTDQQNLAVDEQSIVQLIRALGREDPVANIPQPADVSPPSAPARTAVSSSAGTEYYEPPQGLGRTLVEPEVPQPIWKKPWLIMAAAGAVIILAAVLVIPALISGNHPKPPAADAAAPAASPAALPIPTPAPATATPRVTEKRREPKVVTARPAKQEANPEARGALPIAEPPVSKPAAGSCDLTEGEIPRSLSRADSLMYAGKLEAAQDAYQRILGCPSAHDKAAEGLRLVKQRIAAQSSAIR